MTAHGNGAYYERKIAAVYDGKVRRGSACALFKPICYYTFGSFNAYKTMGFILVCTGTDDIQLFSYFFAKPSETLCREHKVPAKNSEDPNLFRDIFQRDENAQDTSYLSLSRLQTEDPHSKRKRQGSGALSKMQCGVYQKELTGSESGRCLGM